MTTSLSAVFDTLASPHSSSVAKLEAAVSRAFSARERKGLLGAIRGIALSRPALGRPRKATYEGSVLWTTPVTSARGVEGHLHVLLDDDMRIAGVRFTLTDTGAPISAHALQARLAVVADRAAVYGVCGAEVNDLGPRQVAIASLVKLVVVGAVLDSIDDGVMSEYTRVTVRDSDISFLSVGLGEASVGTEIGVVDLCTRALAYSDNTAFDVLLRLVGDAAIERQLSKSDGPLDLPVIRSMRSTILASWGDGEDGDHVAQELRIRQRSVETVVHERGLDYYVPLNVVVPIHQKIAHSPILAGMRNLTPYPDFSYKGGSAPGVFGGSWVSTKHSDVALAFAMNSSQPFGALEEAYSIDQALRFAQFLVSARESS